MFAHLLQTEPPMHALLELTCKDIDCITACRTSSHKTVHVSAVAPVTSTILLFPSIYIRPS